MHYYINPIWFYLAAISSKLEWVLGLTGWMILVIAVIIYLGITFATCELDYDNDYKYRLRRVRKKCTKFYIPLSIVMISLWALLPSREACIQMMVASQVTEENVSAVKEEIYDIVDYVSKKLYNE